MKSVNITDLPTGNYSVSVYDNIEDNQPAYQHPEFLNIVAHSPTPTPSTTVVTRAQYAPGLCVCVRLYVWKKHACLRLTARNSPQKCTLQLPH